MRPVEAFDYDLPEAAIAQEPTSRRSAARLLVAVDGGDPVRHLTVSDLSQLLEPGDLIVVNETKVIPARLQLRKATGGSVEVLLLEQREDCSHEIWEALVRPGRRVSPGTTLYFGHQSAVEVGAQADPLKPDGRRLVRLLAPGLCGYAGALPLPPYIHRPLDDPDRYQTVFASRPSSVAAPTAGLHFDEPLVDACREAGACFASLDLTVGLDTFRPITTKMVEGHRMHSERYSIPPRTMTACQRAGRVLAVGTTTVRALESAAISGRLCGRTELFIHGSFPFKVVDLLMTNFHLPRSSLLVMLEAFCGPKWRSLYEQALQEGYRFLSFGDAMLVSRT